MSKLLLIPYKLLSLLGHYYTSQENLQFKYKWKYKVIFSKAHELLKPAAIKSIIQSTRLSHTTSQLISPVVNLTTRCFKKQPHPLQNTAAHLEVGNTGCATALSTNTAFTWSVVSNVHSQSSFLRYSILKYEIQTARVLLLWTVKIFATEVICKGTQTTPLRNCLILGGARFQYLEGKSLTYTFSEHWPLQTLSGFSHPELEVQQHIGSFVNLNSHWMNVRTFSLKAVAKS